MALNDGDEPMLTRTDTETLKPEPRRHRIPKPSHLVEPASDRHEPKSTPAESCAI